VAGAVSLAVPEPGSLPDQSPEAVQALAPVLDQLRVKLPPGATEVGEADSVTVGIAAPPLDEPDEEPEPPPEELPDELEPVPEEPELLDELDRPPEELELLEKPPELLLEELEVPEGLELSLE
jgi:hypothetical protein